MCEKSSATQLVLFLTEQDDEDAESGDESDDEANEILFDIQEALSLARRQGVLPPVRIARILAGEGTSQFSSDDTSYDAEHRTIPLSVALDYVGAVLDESRKEISRLKVRPEMSSSLVLHLQISRPSLFRNNSPK